MQVYRNKLKRGIKMLLENLFSNVLDMSITASYVVIAVIIIRFIIKKAPKSFYLD